MTINPVIQQQPAISQDLDSAADSKDPLTAAAFQRMEELINPQEQTEEYILQGKGACRNIRAPFRIQPFLIDLVRTLGGHQIESVSATGGAAHYIVFGGSKTLKDLDLTVVMRGPQNAQQIKKTVLELLEWTYGIHKSIEGNRVVFKDQFGQRIVSIPYSGDNDFLFAHGGLEALGAYEETKMVILTFPCVVNGVKRNIDLTILWDPETSCRSSADSLRCELGAFITGDKSRSYLFGADGYLPSESIRLLENGFFTIRPIPRTYQIREGIMGYAHLLTSGLAPDKPELEELFLLKFRREYGKKLYEFSPNLDNFLKRHYQDDSHGAVLYLANFYAAVESAPQRILPPEMKEVVLQQLSAHIAKRRKVAPGAVSKELAVIFWEVADHLSRRLDNLPGSHSTRYRFGRFAPNEKRRGALLPLPWKETLECLLDNDPAMAEKQMKIRAKINDAVPFASPSGRLIQILCQKKFDLSLFAKEFIDRMNRLSPEEIETVQKLLDRIHPQVRIDLNSFFEELQLKDPKIRKDAYIQAIRSGKSLDAIVSCSAECHWDEARGYLQEILDQPFCPPDTALACQRQWLKRGGEADLYALGPRIQSEDAKQLWMDAIQGCQTAVRANTLLAAPFMQGPLGIFCAAELLRRFSGLGDLAGFLQILHEARQRNILPPGEEVLFLMEKFQGQPMEPNTAQSYRKALFYFASSNLPIFDLVKRKGGEWSRAEFVISFAEASPSLTPTERHLLANLLAEYHPDCRIRLTARTPLDFLSEIAELKGWQDVAGKLALHLAKTAPIEDIVQIPDALKSAFPNIADAFYSYAIDRPEALLEEIEIKMLALPFREERTKRILDRPHPAPSEAWIAAVYKNLTSPPREAAARLLIAASVDLSFHRDAVLKILENPKGSTSDYLILFEAAIRQRAIFPQTAWEILKSFKSKQPPLQQFVEILFALLEADPIFCQTLGLEFFSPLKHTSLMKSKERISDCWKLFCAFAKIPHSEPVSDLEKCAVEFLLQGNKSIDNFVHTLFQKTPEERAPFLSSWEKLAGFFEERISPTFAKVDLTEDLSEFPAWNKSVRKELLTQVKKGREADADVKTLLEQDAFSIEELREMELSLRKSPLHIEIIKTLLSKPDLKAEVARDLLLRGCAKDPTLALAEKELIKKYAPFEGLKIALFAYEEGKIEEWKQFAQELLEQQKTFSNDELDLGKKGVLLNLLSAEELWRRASLKPLERFTQLLPFCMELDGFDSDLAKPFLADLLSQKIIDNKCFGQILRILEEHPKLEDPTFAPLIIAKYATLKSPLEPARFMTYYHSLSENEQISSVSHLLKFLGAAVAKKIPTEDLDSMIKRIQFLSSSVTQEHQSELLALCKTLILSKDMNYVSLYRELFDSYFDSEKIPSSHKTMFLSLLIEFISKEASHSFPTAQLLSLHRRLNQNIESFSWDDLCKTSTNLMSLYLSLKPYQIIGELGDVAAQSIADLFISKLVPRGEKQRVHLPPELLRTFHDLGKDLENHLAIRALKENVLIEKLKHPKLFEETWLELPRMTLYLTPDILLSFMHVFEESLSSGTLRSWQAMYAFVALQQQMHILFTYLPFTIEQLPHLQEILKKNMALRDKLIPFINEQIPTQKAKDLSDGLECASKGKSRMPCKILYSNALHLQALAIGKIVRNPQHPLRRQFIREGTALLNAGIDQKWIEMPDLPHFLFQLAFVLPDSDEGTQNTLFGRVVGLFTGTRYGEYSREQKRIELIRLVEELTDSKKMENHVSLTHIELATEILDLAAEQRLIQEKDNTHFFKLLNYLTSEIYCSHMTERKAKLILTCCKRLLSTALILTPLFTRDPDLWKEYQLRIDLALQSAASIDQMRQMRSEIEKDWNSLRPQINRMLGN